MKRLRAGSLSQRLSTVFAVLLLACTCLSRSLAECRTSPAREPSMRKGRISVMRIPA